MCSLLVIDNITVTKINSSVVHAVANQHLYVNRNVQSELLPILIIHFFCIFKPNSSLIGF